MSRRLPLRRVYRRVWRIYRWYWRSLVLVAAIIFVPLHGLDALAGALTGGAALSPVRLVGILVVVAVNVAANSLGAQVYSGAVGAIVHEDHTGQRRERLARVARSLPYKEMILADLAYSAILVVGFTMLIVPGIVFMVWFALTGPLVTEDRRGVRHAFSRSRYLVRGNFWRVFLVYVSFVVITQVVDAALSMLVGFGFVGFGRAWLTAVAASLVVGPFVGLATVVMMFELADIKDPDSTLHPAHVVLIGDAERGIEPVAHEVAQRLAMPVVALEPTEHDAVVEALSDATPAVIHAPPHVAAHPYTRRLLKGTRLCIVLRSGAERRQYRTCAEVADLVIDMRGRERAAIVDDIVENVEAGTRTRRADG